MSSGYSDGKILERVTQATRAVVSGKASFERDSVLFYKHDYRFPVLASLLRAAALNGGKLQVVDFGGSLGSTYRQCRPLLEGLRINWWIVEQPTFVAAGRREFSTDELHFAETTAELPGFASHGIILACGVLQYVEHPFLILKDLCALNARHLVIDRLPISETPSDRLCVQHTPRTIYSGSYPCWIFSRNHLLSFLLEKWNIAAEFSCEEAATRTDDGTPFEFRGIILEKKS